MFKNYFKTAWRNITRNKMASAINIGGLAVGMAVAILIGLWVYDELSYNKHYKNYERIAQVMQSFIVDGKINSQVSTPFPIGKELQTKYGSDFKYVVMASWLGDHILSSNDKYLSKEGIYMDKDADKMLSLKMLKGAYGGLSQPNSILLSASAAKAFFGDADPVGKAMKIDNRLNVNVTGVYEDMPKNTAFNNATFIAPWELFGGSEEWIRNARDYNLWDNNSFQVFVQLADNADFNTVNKKIHNLNYDHHSEENKKLYNPHAFLYPMRSWHLYNRFENGKSVGGAIEYVRMFLGIGIVVLLLACINFMNLSTARSEKRAKEVGIRKTVGSLRKQLIGQFYSESLLIVLFAFVLAAFLAQQSLHMFNMLANKELKMPWNNQWFWLASTVFILITTFISGSYPALYLSGFNPVKVLKGTFRVGRFASVPRKVLVVVQFTNSLILIIGTLIVYNQIQYAKNRPIGYNKNALMMVQLKTTELNGKFDLLRNELQNTGAIKEVAESTSPLSGIWSNNSGYIWEGKGPDQNSDFATTWVTPEYGKTIGWQILQGRDFSRDFKTDSLGIVINEAALKYMNLKAPIGTIIRNQYDTVRKRAFKIIGVAKNIIAESPYDQVRPAFYFLTENDESWVNIKLNPEKSAGESIAKISSVFKKFLPSVPFEYKFSDEEFARKFAAEERIGKLSSFFAGLAIFISCLGLFGLASFVAEQKTKEIGIRKVLGASVTNLWLMLSKDFVYLVIISCVIAAPLAWYFMHQWLKGYDYRTNISMWVFLVAGGSALAIAMLTVSYHAIKAALANPVKSLKTE